MMLARQFKLDGKAALITGGSRGLGLEIAKTLHEAGAKIALLARRAADLQQAQKVLPKALVFEADVTQVEQIADAVKETAAQCGGLHILVNAAGMAWGAPAIDMPPEKLHAVLTTNIEGTYLACQAAAKIMRKQDYGKIINLASIAGMKGLPPSVLDAAPYSASKGAIISLTRDLAVKWAGYGIRVNSLAPGFFRTRMTEKLLAHNEKLINQATPLGHIGQTGELGPAALFLAAPASDYVTGQTLCVDGGASIA